jgi:hypothetical protein
VSDGAVNAPFVAEQLALEQRRWQRGAVAFGERVRAARAQAMDGAATSSRRCRSLRRSTVESVGATMRIWSNIAHRGALTDDAIMNHLIRPGLRQRDHDCSPSRAIQVCFRTSIASIPGNGVAVSILDEVRSRDGIAAVVSRAAPGSSGP